MTPTLLALSMLLAPAMPPLDAADRTQLGTADDGGPFDEAALYPLLRNALRWRAGERQSRDAPPPDYETLRAAPADARGRVYAIEGRYAGRSRRLTLARPGPWGEALTEWGLIVRDEPEEVAIVMLVDPAERLSAPRAGATVRVTGRFYKLWGDRDLRGRWHAFLTFVAPAEAVEVLEAEDEAGATPPTGSVIPAGLLLVLVALAGGYVAARVYIARTAGPRESAAKRHRPAAPGPSHAADVEAPPLPTDPADALAAMDHRSPAEATHRAPPGGS